MAIALVAGGAAAGSGQRVDCAPFQREVRRTYGFHAAKLSEAQQRVKGAEIDAFWTQVKTGGKAALICLRTSLQERTDSGLFLVDGSNLLLSIDSSSEAKALQVRAYTAASLADVDSRVWVETLARRGLEGYDVSQAGERWLRYADAQYSLPEHGGYEVGRSEGALYLFASMPESLATPALTRLIAADSPTVRKIALYLLMGEATPEALQTLRSVSPAAFPDSTRTELRDYLAHPPLFARRPGTPLSTRAEYVSAFDSVVADDWRPLDDIAERVPDGERDVVTVMGATDIPLIRLARRHMIAVANQHGTEYYTSMTQILLTLIWDQK